MTTLQLKTELSVLKEKADFFKTRDTEKARQLTKRFNMLAGDCLTRGSLVKYYETKRDNKDARRKVAVAIFSYHDNSGFEYRKTFTAKAGTPEELFYDITPEVITL